MVKIIRDTVKAHCLRARQGQATWLPSRCPAKWTRISCTSKTWRCRGPTTANSCRASSTTCTSSQSIIKLHLRTCTNQIISHPHQTRWTTRNKWHIRRLAKTCWTDLMKAARSSQSCTMLKWPAMLEEEAIVEAWMGRILRPRATFHHQIMPIALSRTRGRRVVAR